MIDARLTHEIRTMEVTMSIVGCNVGILVLTILIFSVAPSALAGASKSDNLDVRGDLRREQTETRKELRDLMHNKSQDRSLNQERRTQSNNEQQGEPDEDVHCSVGVDCNSDSRSGA